MCKKNLKSQKNSWSKNQQPQKNFIIPYINFVCEPFKTRKWLSGEDDEPRGRVPGGDSGEPRQDVGDGGIT